MENEREIGNIKNRVVQAIVLDGHERDYENDMQSRVWTGGKYAILPRAVDVLAGYELSVEYYDGKHPDLLIIPFPGNVDTMAEIAAYCKFEGRSVLDSIMVGGNVFGGFPERDTSELRERLLEYARSHKQRYELIDKIREGADTEQTSDHERAYQEAGRKVVQEYVDCLVRDIVELADVDDLKGATEAVQRGKQHLVVDFYTEDQAVRRLDGDKFLLGGIPARKENAARLETHEQQVDAYKQLFAHYRVKEAEVFDRVIARLSE